MIWKEAVLAYFKVLSRNFLGETEEITKNMCRYIRYWDRYLNPGPPELEALGLTARPPLSVRSAGLRYPTVTTRPTVTLFQWFRRKLTPEIYRPT
jgi:hypothetical protein